MRDTGRKNTLSFVAWAACASFALAASAQAQSGYRVSEGDANPAPAATNPAASSQEAGPVRLARFSYINGSVSWRPSEDVDWADASLNLPLRQGGEIWVSPGGRAEVQFDDGSILRLGSGGIATLQTLFSDDRGEFTEIKVTNGLASLRVKSKLSEFQVDSPLVSVKAFGPAKLRVGAEDGVEVAVQEGEARIEGDRGKVTMETGEYLDLRDDKSDYAVRDLPAPDSWDQFNNARDEQLSHPDANVPSNIGIVAGDLDEYGAWRHDERYGEVWCPRVTEVDWMPYHHGRWVWVEPFGWTWCSTEAWGWAPYHYGTWVHEPYGWAWVPGPVQQYWSPAVVSFAYVNGSVSWCALAPGEVRYPSVLAVGFHRGNWWASFSIGGAAMYCPSGPNFCEARPWRNGMVNHVKNVYNITHITNVYNNTTVINNGGHNVFMPRNAATHGFIHTSAETFARGGRFETVGAGQADVFRRGANTVALNRSTPFYAGPAHVLPSRESLSTPRSINRPGSINRPVSVPQARDVARPVYRGTLPTVVRNQATPIGRTRNVPSNTGTRSNDPYDRFNDRTPRGNTGSGTVDDRIRNRGNGSGSSPMGNPGRTTNSGSFNRGNSNYQRAPRVTQDNSGPSRNYHYSEPTRGRSNTPDRTPRSGGSGNSGRPDSGRGNSGGQGGGGTERHRGN